MIQNIVEFNVNKTSFVQAFFELVKDLMLTDREVSGIALTASHSGAVVDRGEYTIEEALFEQFQEKYGEAENKAEAEANYYAALSE